MKTAVLSLDGDSFLTLICILVFNGRGYFFRGVGGGRVGNSPASPHACY